MIWILDDHLKSSEYFDSFSDQPQEAISECKCWLLTTSVPPDSASAIIECSKRKWDNQLIHIPLTNQLACESTKLKVFQVMINSMFMDALTVQECLSSYFSRTFKYFAYNWHYFPIKWWLQIEIIIRDGRFVQREMRGQRFEGEGPTTELGGQKADRIKKAERFGTTGRTVLLGGIRDQSDLNGFEAA